MKKTLLLGLGSIALALGGLAIARGVTNKPLESEATLGTTSGVVGIEFASGVHGAWNTADDTHYVAFNFKDAKGNDLGWSEAVSITSAAFKYLVPFSDLSETPAQMEAFRLRSSVTDSELSDNRSGLQDFSDCMYIKAWEGNGDYRLSVFNVSPTYVPTNKTDWKQTEDNTLKNLRINASNNFEVYGDVTFTEFENFKVVDADTEYRNDYSTSGIEDYCFSKYDNIACNVPGTYTVGYDITTHTINITSPKIKEATDFASEFLTRTYAICNEGGTSADHAASLAEIWNAKDDGEKQLVELWGELSPEAKQTIIATSPYEEGIQTHKMVFKYQHIMSRYSGSLSPFTGIPTTSAAFVTNAPYVTSGNGVVTMAVTFGVTAALTSLAAVFYFRKRRSI